MKLEGAYIQGHQVQPPAQCRYTIKAYVPGDYLSFSLMPPVLELSPTREVTGYTVILIQQEVFPEIQPKSGFL